MELPHTRRFESIAPIWDSEAEAAGECFHGHAWRVEQIQIDLMNEYCVDMPLWDREGSADDGWWGPLLSVELKSDLRSFQERWEAAVPEEVFDDRFDDLPFVQMVVDAGRAVRRFFHPAERRAVAREAAAIEAQGELLRDRLQQELGNRYRVTYVR
ncbi:hypothetical protein [Aeromicrobium flavum]|uniref:hypothetical protein n=1 Tax=Aeromicrobium flavum TaxID=416568 RepID=UPI001C99F986|nr:hypothetical protein [Aeromicrobium flavum]